MSLIRAPRRYWTQSVLFLATLGAAGMWSVSFSTVLRAHHLESLIAYALAWTALAAFAAPLIAGGLADQRIPPERLLRWLTMGAAVFLALGFCAIEFTWGTGAVLGFFLLHSLCNTPVYSILSAVIFADLPDAAGGFARVRVWGTVGWALGGWLVSWGLRADNSTLSGFAAAAVLFGTGVGLGGLRETRPPDEKPRRSWREVLGWDALSLFRQHDHRAVLLVTILFCIPLAAFTPFTPLHLRALGFEHPTATMTLGQVGEIICMVWLASVLRRFRLKWIFLAAIALAVVRYGLFTLDTRGAVLAGIALHGFCYTLFFITAQVYMAERIDLTMRARAQSLFFLIYSGVGNFTGYLATGWWKVACMTGTETNWRNYWGGLCVTTMAVGLYFLASYSGVGRGSRRAED